MASTTQEMVQQLTARANSDSAFASLLLSDPMKAAASEFGRLPGGMTVHAEKASDGQIKVSVNADSNSVEMSTEELESVVGGDGFPGPISLP